jgi:hypothetical protein
LLCLVVVVVRPLRHRLGHPCGGRSPPPHHVCEQRPTDNYSF